MLALYALRHVYRRNSGDATGDATGDAVSSFSVGRKTTGRRLL